MCEEIESLEIENIELKVKVDVLEIQAVEQYVMIAELESKVAEQNATIAELELKTELLENDVAALKRFVGMMPPAAPPPMSPPPVMPPGLPPGTFTTKSGLMAAVVSWISDPIAAEVVYGNISNWDVRSVNDMSYLFCGSSNSGYFQFGCDPVKATFNGNISQWDVSAVTNMERMFWGATAFDQPLDWNVSSLIATSTYSGGTYKMFWHNNSDSGCACPGTPMLSDCNKAIIGSAFADFHSDAPAPHQFSWRCWQCPTTDWSTLPCP